MGNQQTGTADATLRIREIGAGIEEDIIALRRYFHQHPELGAHEVETSAYVRARLDKMRVPYRLVRGKRPFPAEDGREDFIGTGIIATIRGTAPGAYDGEGKPTRCIALRTDMDALPITERTEVPYASANEGVMHACGHDCHMAMMLGAVRILSEMRDRLRGEVRIIFQPAEEISIGARDMIAAGALDGVDAIYGAHIWSEVDAGIISCEAGPRMANTDWFRIDIEGVSAHGSMPHKGVDAIVVAAEVIDSLQVIVSRRTSPFEPVVITVGEVHGGTARNIMAGSVYLTGTLRTWHRATREKMIDRMERAAGKVSHAFGANISFSFEEGNPGVSNDEECAAVASRAVVEVLGQDALGSYEGTLAGEDFAEYLQHVPGVFVFVGTNNPDIGAVHPQHSCYYTIDESVLAKGSMVAAQWACDMLE
ncbi:MAG TPA: amidohydrolase [Eggerthellaceae bacterium]|nr:amidohydrolase [Eggerthellaceae bacterium]